MQEKVKKPQIVRFCLGAALIFLLSLCFFGCFYSWQGKRIKKINIADKVTIKVEKVMSDEKRYSGLSGRSELCEHCGMLFVMPEIAQPTFSMRGMRFNLDFIWIRENKIIDLNKDVPWDYSGKIRSNYLSDQVLELPAGTCDKYEIGAGDEIF